MTGLFLPQPLIRAVDASGAPLPGARMQFYLTGSTTPAVAYANAALSTPLSNPVVADSGGLFPPIWLDPAVVYRLQVLTSAGALIQDIDPLSQPQAVQAGAVTAAMLAAGSAQANLGFAPVNRSGDTAVNLTLAFTGLSSTSAGYLGAPLNEQDGAYTFALSDAGKLVRANSASPITYTLPPNSAVAFPPGSVILVRNAGAGTVTLARGAGVSQTIAGAATNKDVSLVQNGVATLVQEAANTWVAMGTGIS